MSSERSWNRGGVVLTGWEHAGPGPTVILLHGWCCDRGFLEPQIEHLASLGHHVVAFDQRGHGGSGWNGESIDIGVFADDVAWLIEELGLGRAMIAGHSMGGLVALELANRRAELVERIALLDSIVAIPPDLTGAVEGLSLLLDSPRCADTIDEFIRKWLVTDQTDRVLVDRVVETMRSAPREVAVDCWRSLVTYDDRGALKACPVPMLFVAAGNSVSRLEELPDMNPGLELACIRGASHFLTLEAPDATNELLERFFRP